MDNSKCCREQYKKLTKILKKSLVPLPCQDCQLSEDNCRIQSECLEWLTDLSDKFNVPIWSRLINMNTSGFIRNLPISMRENYHIEIKGRLWSLWGSLHCCKPKPCNCCYKPYLGVIVVALCAARVIHLRIWKPLLLDIIRYAGRRYFRESLKLFDRCRKEFDLQDLSTCCCLYGLKFQVRFQTVQEGRLYSTPLENQNNLSYALLKFFECHQYGILECLNRYLGFGYNENVPAGYFMFDAQSMNYPIFCKNSCAPYLLRTNHLQVLVYCLTVGLNIRFSNAPFALHCVHIKPICFINDLMKELQKVKVCICQTEDKRILPEEYWCTPPPSPVYSENDLLNQIVCGKDVQFIKRPEPKPVSPLDRYVRPSRVTECVNGFKVMPLIEVKRKTDETDNENDASEEEKKLRTFVRMICSETVVPYTASEEAAKLSKSFVTDLNTLLATGCGTRLQTEKQETLKEWLIRKTKRKCT